MRAIAFVVALAATLLIAFLAYLVLATAQRRRQTRMSHAARWKLRHFGEQGATVVTTSLMLPDGRVLDQHVVARIAEEDPEWTAKFLAATQDAQERAFHLNAAGPELSA
jgi:pyridoxamine 5'-phosphate oxidase family protein